MPDPTAGRLPQLAAGLLLGLVAALVCLVVSSRRRSQPANLAGLALGAAAAVGFAVTRPPGTPTLPWPLLALATAAAAAVLADFERRWSRLRLLPVLLAVTAAGVWATVPDVEAALVLLGAGLPIGLLGWPGPPARWPSAPTPAGLRLAGASAAAGVLVWAIATGGAGRPGSIVGGLACLGLLGVEPAVRHLDPRRRSPLDLIGERPGLAWSAVAAHAALVGIASRVVGRPGPAATALLLAALELALALAAGAALARRAANGQRTRP